MLLLLTINVLKSGGECVISSCLFIAARGDAVEVSLAQFVEQLRSKCKCKITCKLLCTIYELHTLHVAEAHDKLQDVIRKHKKH